MNEKLNELMQKHFELKKEIEELVDKDNVIKEEIKFVLKQEGIDKYEDKEQNLITYREQTRESVDKRRVKELLGEIQFQTVVKKSTFGVLKILHHESREKMKKMLDRR